MQEKKYYWEILYARFHVLYAVHETNENNKTKNQWEQIPRKTKKRSSIIPLFQKSFNINLIYIAAAKTEYFFIKQSKISISIALNHIAGLFVRNFNRIPIIDHKMICNSLDTYYVAHDIEIKSKYQSYFKNLIWRVEYWFDSNLLT